MSLWQATRRQLQTRRVVLPIGWSFITHLSLQLTLAASIYQMISMNLRSGNFQMAYQLTDTDICSSGAMTTHSTHPVCTHLSSYPKQAKVCSFMIRMQTGISFSILLHSELSRMM